MHLKSRDKNSVAFLARANADAVSTMLWFLIVAVAMQNVVAGRHYFNTFENLTAKEIDEKVVVDATTGIAYNPYSKYHPGRHVCTAQKEFTVPVKSKEIVCRPVYKKYNEKCNGNQICSGVKLVFETSYKDVVNYETSTRIVYICCPGWNQIDNRSYGCNKPTCTGKCENGGTCLNTNICNCLQGFTGRFCEEDVNECKNKPCDQICHNTVGSFKCECRENFILLDDGQSCRKEGDDDVALEAKDLQYKSLDNRLHKLETAIIENFKVTQQSEVSKLSNNFQNIADDLIFIKKKLNKLDQYSEDISTLKYRLNQLEKISEKTIKNGHHRSFFK